MSVKVSDCLKFPSLKEATVIAGINGLDRIVGSISVLEYVDFWVLSHDFFIGNELILTAFTSAKDDIKTQCKTIRRLAEAGEVGIVLYYVGIFLPKVDKKLIKIADELDFPIILMPQGKTEFRYSDVIGEVSEAIILDKKHDAYFVNDLLDSIAQLNEYQRTIGTVLRLLSDRLRCTFLLLDKTMKSIAFAKWPVSNSLSDGIIIEDLIANHFNISQDIQFVQKSGNSESNTQTTHFSTDSCENLILVSVDETNKISKEHLLNATELLQLFSSIWNYSLDYIQPDALISAIINNIPDKMHLIAKSFGLDMTSIDTMIAINSSSTKESLRDKHRLYGKVAIDLSLFLKDYGLPVVVDEFENSLIIMHSSSNIEDHTSFIHEMSQVVLHHSTDLTMTVCSNLEDTADVKESYLKWKSGISIVKKIFPKLDYYNSSDIDFAIEINALLDKDESAFELDPTLTPLKKFADFDELIATLQVYLLDAQKSIKLTSEYMYLHRNTVQYRMKKIKNCLFYDFEAMPGSYSVYRAVAKYRLSKSK